MLETSVAAGVGHSVYAVNSNVDCFLSADSTPSYTTASPQSDESKPEDDSVFLSPTKARTTEDLFAMIHR